MLKTVKELHTTSSKRLSTFMVKIATLIECAPRSRFLYLLFNDDLGDTEVAVSDRLNDRDEQVHLVFGELHIKVDGIGVDGVRLHIDVDVCLTLGDEGLLDDLLDTLDDVEVDRAAEDKLRVLGDEDGLCTAARFLLLSSSLLLKAPCLGGSCRLLAGYALSFKALALYALFGLTGGALSFEPCLLLDCLTCNLGESGALCLLDPRLLGDSLTGALLLFLAAGLLLAKALYLCESLLLLAGSCVSSSLGIV